MVLVAVVDYDHIVPAAAPLEFQNVSLVADPAVRRNNLDPHLKKKEELEAFYPDDSWIEVTRDTIDDVVVEPPPMHYHHHRFPSRWW
mmetsp:Transcript_613/g.950  ORF Transcript_613/g.950 Transcript_613/m.950 type:complete len:87 (-) Transcript_613:1674-1934(-)